MFWEGELMGSTIAQLFAMTLVPLSSVAVCAAEVAVCSIVAKSTNDFGQPNSITKQLCDLMSTCQVAKATLLIQPMVLLAFRHGLRASELVDLRWEQVDLENAILHVRRVKQGTPATHPLTGRELRALRRLQREQRSKSPFVFVSERGAPFSKRGFQAVVERAARAAGFEMKIHPHMLRHSCGYKLANDGIDTRTIQSYLGHKSIQHTVRYTELAPTRFKSLFRD
jgi:integrase